MNNIVYGLELIIFIALCILEYLSGYKAGVMKHLYFKKMEYLSKIYTQNGMLIHSIILLCLFIGLMIIYKNRWNDDRKKSMIRFFIYGIVLISGFYLPYMKELNTYVYTLMFLEIAIGIESIKMILNK
ncbi:MAG: hypothetical protein N4A62_12885 [Marinisporobacter sp.]|nr:hypothetical protein [Marinisporobacter sp.]